MEDRTEFQTDTETRKWVSTNGPARKWYYQRLMAMLSFACVCWWPVVVFFHPAADEISVLWFSFHGGVVITWFGGSTISSLKR